jgi:proteasome lid subunit RPN8/RPN11
MIIQLRREDYAQIIAHAKKGLPNEACGLLAGTTGDVQTIEAVYLLSNIDRSATHFSIDPKEHLAAIKDMRKNGYIPLGNFHSHPSTPARPSEEDIRMAYDPQASYLIVSLADQEPDIKAFAIQNHGAQPVEIEFV